MKGLLDGKWLSRITFWLHNLAPKHLNPKLQRVTAKCLFDVLRVAENLRMKINSEL